MMSSAYQKSALTLSCLVLIVSQCSASKILVMPLSGGSHVLAVTTLSQELVKRGHEVHMMIGATLKLTSDLAANDSKINIVRFGSPDAPLDYDDIQDTTMAKVLEENAGMWELMGFLNNVVELEARQLLINNDEVMERLEKIKFDIAIVDSLFFMKYRFLIPLRLGIPWVMYGDMLPTWNVRTPHLPSFVPTKMTTYSDRMSFFQRTANLLFSFAPYIYALPDPPEEVLAKYRKYGHFDRVDDLISRSVLFIVTSDVALDYPAPAMPNTIQVGGITVKPASGRKLPKDIDDYMASAKDGIILVTFGSMASRLPKHVAEKFIEVFEQLQTYKIIWRFTNKDNLIIPKNVMISKWLPQNDILADPRVKLFVTHSGNNGQFEAMYHAVPMIGFPIMGDQPFNAQRLKNRGYGIPMNLHDFTAEELKENIMKILTDGSYKRRISKASEIFRSARESPAERAAYWIEHVIRFGGDHLRSAGNELNFFQYFMLDIALFLFVIISILSLSVILVLRFIAIKIYRKFSTSSSSSQNGNAYQNGSSKKKD